MDSGTPPSSPTERPRPLHVIDWGTHALGPRFTELEGERHWKWKRSIWHDTDVGYILYRPHRDGTYVPFEWKVQRAIPRPPLRR